MARARRPLVALALVVLAATGAGGVSLAAAAFPQEPGSFGEGAEARASVPAVVRFADEGAVDRAAVEALGARVAYPFQYVPALGVLAPPHVQDALAGLPGVVRVEPVPRFVPVLDVSTRAMQARSSALYAGADSASCGAGVTVAVLDTGVDNNHESLAGKWVGGADVSNTMALAALPPLNEVDATDDNAAVASWGVPYGPASPPSADPNDLLVGASVAVGLSHGTHVAGIAVGTGGPSGTHQGVAPCAKLVDVKVLSGTGYGASPSPNDAFQNPFGVFAGLEWVLDYNHGKTRFGDTSATRVRVVNLSLTSPCGSAAAGTLEDLVDTVVAHGIVVVAAAGNCGALGGVMAPGTARGAITVGAFDDRGTVGRADDRVAGFSSTRDFLQEAYGLRKPDVSAPGVAIMSARGAAYSAVVSTVQPQPGGPLALDALCFAGLGAHCGLDSYESAIPNSVGTTLPASVVRENGYHPLSGTSMSTPHVAGVVALMLSVAPDLSPADVKRILQQTAVGDGAWHADRGHGFVDALAAVSAAGGGSGIPPSVAIVQPLSGLRAWGAAASLCLPQLEVYAHPGSGSLASVRLALDDGPYQEIGGQFSGGYYRAPWDGLPHTVHVVATNSHGHTQREDRHFVACGGLPGAAPGARTTPADRLTAHLAVGATAGLVAPSGKTLKVRYLPPVLPAPVTTSAVVTVALDGTVTEARPATAGAPAVSTAWFQVEGTLVGEPADGTWIVEAGHRLTGLPGGIRVQVQGKTFDHVARGESCYGALNSANSQPASEGGDGTFYWAGDQVSFVKLWNWHQTRGRYDTGCNPATHPYLGATNPEESPQHATFFAPFPGGTP